MREHRAMPDHTHQYAVTVTWTGNTGSGTSDHRSYSRDHEVRAGDNPLLVGSADPNFRGDPTRWNPEELLVAAISQCHMLWYLALAAKAKVVVTAYRDDAQGEMETHRDGSGEFTSVTLRPHVSVADASMIETADALHEAAKRMCFIARSVSFPVRHEARTGVDPDLD